MASIKIEGCVKRHVPLLPWGRVAGRPEMTLEAQSLAYIPGVCVFPTHKQKLNLVSFITTAFLKVLVRLVRFLLMFLSVSLSVLS